MCFLVLSAQWGVSWDPVLRGRIKRIYAFSETHSSLPLLGSGSLASTASGAGGRSSVCRNWPAQKKHICILIFRYLSKYSDTSNWYSDTPRLLSPWDSPGKNTGVSCHSLFHGIFPIQGLNCGLPHCRQSCQGSPSSDTSNKTALTPQQSAATLYSFQTDLGTSLLNKGDHQRVASHLGETELQQKRTWKEKEEEDKNKKQNPESNNLRETKADYWIQELKCHAPHNPRGEPKNRTVPLKS